MRAFPSPIFAAILLALHACACGFVIAAEPDQVLVLYNSDYGIDQDGSEPGQDSKEVAEYYVRRHSDPVTGKKPWLLGLSCVHCKDHLDQFRLPEDSQENRFGVEYVGAGEPPREWPAYDSRQVVVFLSKDEAQKVHPQEPCRADTREPVWGTTAFGDRNGEITIHSIRIFDNANPAPDEHTHPYASKFHMKQDGPASHPEVLP